MHCQDMTSCHYITRNGGWRSDKGFYFSLLFHILYEWLLNIFSFNEYCISMCIVHDTFYCTRNFLLQLIFLHDFNDISFCNSCDLADCCLCSNFLIIIIKAQGIFVS